MPARIAASLTPTQTQTVRDRAAPAIRPVSRPETLAGASPPADQDSSASCARRSPVSRKARTTPCPAATRRILPRAGSSNATSARVRPSASASSAKSAGAGTVSAASRIRTPPAPTGSTTAYSKRRSQGARRTRSAAASP
ncbi:hypothetical protein G6F22_018175 [Rhizopus arrhizus]|nr:hypothetical protein G6F22_018175 [Rhizopus arrhizus]